jgi:hypothetical protein
MSDGNIISLEGKRKKAVPECDHEKGFYEIMSDFEGAVISLLYPSMYPDCCDLDLDRYWRMSNKQKAAFLLDQAAKVHDLAKRLLEAATKEDPKRAS